MPDTPLVVFVITVILALFYAYSNGINDAANAIATVISTKVMPPMAAVAMGASMSLLGALTGAFVVGTSVAKTIGGGIVDPDRITEFTVMGAILASVLWVLSATRFGFPISVSHSLVASLVGAGLATAGVASIKVAGVTKVLIALAISPVLGFLFAFAAMVGLYWLVRRASPSAVRVWFTPLQVLAGAFMSYSHGKNDGQNSIGIIALAATYYYGRGELIIDLWMVLLSGLAIAIGIASGGWRVIRTLGMRLTKLEPIHGFAASMAGATVIEAASQIGLPVSTTHTISSSIMGVGATRRLSAVRWGVTRSIALAWLVTYPVCFVLGWIISSLLKVVF